ncbi:hypothetical protein GCM10017673_46360 [Streptosporangium violaceochromogenes]|nr:hypothetical protein GCM10017673_46360 [Streptosporangium violaceochromogenes]
MSRLRRPAELAAEELADVLGRERQAADVRRADELERTTAQAAHERARADVAVSARLAELERAEIQAAASADAELARMYRSALASGERIRIQAGLSRSAEARALRLERLRGLNLRVLVPVLAGFAAWSATGVQAGAARLMAATPASPMWWALWLLEPVLIGAVVWVIIARARLASAGGRLADAAERIAWGCLGTSVALNLIAGSTEGGTVLTMAGAMLAHAIGPVGAAATAHLIGVVDSSISAADPWTERGERVPRLAEMDLRPPAPAVPGSTAQSTIGSSAPAAPEPAAPAPASVWPVPVDGRALLPIVARPKAPSAPAQSPARTGDDQGEHPAPKAPRKPRPATRPNKGARVPAALRAAAEPSPRTLPDDVLAGRLAALVQSGDLASDAPVRAVQAALGIGFDRAKRIRALAESAAEAVAA